MAAFLESLATYLTKYKWGSGAEVVTATATGLGLIVAFLAIRAKRRDDRRNDRLNRVNRQLSEFYGKLSILNEAGMRDWCSFIAQHGSDSKILGREFVRFFPFDVTEDEPITKFNPPDPTAEQMRIYRKWHKALFLKTNKRMLEVIYANADLVVGGVMPQVLIHFAEHVASVKLMQRTLDEEEQKVKSGSESLILDNWRQYTTLMAPHPGDFGYYISASFEVLKAEQERLLSTHRSPLTEKELTRKIRLSMWDKECYWMKRQHEARAAAGQLYTLKLPPKPKSELQELVIRMREWIQKIIP